MNHAKGLVSVTGETYELVRYVGQRNQQPLFLIQRVLCFGGESSVLKGEGTFSASVGAQFCKWSSGVIYKKVPAMKRDELKWLQAVNG